MVEFKSSLEQMSVFKTLYQNGQLKSAEKIVKND